MNEPDRILELLTQIRDELRESRERTLRRYDEVISAQATTEKLSVEYWSAYERKFRLLTYGYLTMLVVILAATILVLALKR